MNQTNENRDFVAVVEDLEESQRRDLAVHLYLTFLLHRVNPYFPTEKWASWPVPLERVVDPQAHGGYEDEAVADSFRESYDKPQWSHRKPEVQPILLDDEKEELKFASERCQGAVSVSHKRVSKTNPKAVLANEMHAALQRAIYKKASRLAKPGQRVSVGETKIANQMALKLANRLDKVLYTLKSQGTRRAFHTKTWQDVLIANLQTDGYGEVIDLASNKRAYSGAKKLFKDPKYNYEYDSLHYGDGISGEAIPAFDLAHHMTTITEESRIQFPKSRPPLEVLETLEKEIEMKEHVFWTLYNQKKAARGLSWKESDILSDYEPPEGEFDDERRKVFQNKQTALGVAQFEVDDGYA